VPALILLQATALRSCVGGNGNGSAAASTTAHSLLVPSISSSSRKIYARKSASSFGGDIDIFSCVVISLIFF